MPCDSQMCLNTNNVHFYHPCLSAGPEEDEALRGRKGFRGQALVSQSPETELMLDGDDDAVSLLQEKEVDNLAGESTYTQYTVQSV